MRRPMAKRNLIVSIALIGCGVAVCAWQVEEHFRFERTEKDALIKRGRDITSTLGVVLRSQRRYGLFLVKERIEASLEALVQPGEPESIAILAVTGEPLASAGRPIDLTPEQIQAGGATWGDRTLTLMNLMDLGSGGTDDGTHPTTAILMTNDERKSLRPANSPRSGEAAASAAGPAGCSRQLGADDLHPLSLWQTLVDDEGAIRYRHSAKRGAQPGHFALD